MSSGGTILTQQPLVFVDIETNGLDHIRGRVIEIAAIRVEQGKVVKKISTLLDPETPLPEFISGLTGISRSDLISAPTFMQIADELYEVMDGALFVAHNVRFDYSFLKQEFRRLNRSFSPKQLCTARLSRTLYPHERSHKLESVINRHGFSFQNRHRAYDDAAVLWQFVQYILKHFPPEQISAAVSKQLRTPSLPQHLQPEIVKNLPEVPGVYIFEDDDGTVLYIGKSTNIKKRVLSHFSRDHAEVKEFKLAQVTKHIRTEQTAGELGALLLESNLIKELQPVYNRKLRRLSKLLLVQQTFDQQGYAQVSLREASVINPENSSSVLAVYPSRGRAKNALNELVKTFSLCPKLMGLEKSKGACFLSQLGKCAGACKGNESIDDYNQRLLLAFENQRIHAWPFKGPVLLQEKDQNGTVQGIIVDTWCVLGQITEEPYCEPVITSSEKAFDLDTYKILQSHLRHKLKNITIQTLSLHQLSQLGV